MISVIISCSNCGHAVVLNPTEDNQSDVTSTLRKENKFYATISYVDSSEPKIEDDFIAKLTTESKENIRDFVEQNIIEQVDIYTELLDVTFTCKECGDSIELKDI
ncbi:hypothetical protein OB236_23900 [Paenibacillus sp. WQ 127069]|uniref:Uncharacterized protein n=1 Tax=Paenibacillus baimaensis TaxID=2982185 RepID=A0ABT2UKI1_9BACL|nr:hypothetical protein [Paenibacillus sp. WQ 127069]MCU6795155.1 hypothetical protein [Paenibacillus sp. WQ 127069]